MSAMSLAAKVDTISPLPFGIGDPDLGRRCTMSAHALDGTKLTNERFDAWYADQIDRNRFDVERIAFRDLRGWHFDGPTGNLTHSSGRFFTVEGLRLRTDWGHSASWTQPIINQPEIGILGIVVKEIDGVLHCLLQAKMEPGNINTIQISPTVQATRSNYNGTHGGRAITYLEYFTDRRRSRVVVDSLQSEQASWFLHKRNRNMVVEVTEDIPLHDGFCWLTIGQVHRLLDVPNAINMDVRTVLSCLPFEAPNSWARSNVPGSYRESLVRSMTATAPTAEPLSGVLGWLTQIKATHELVQHSIPLNQLENWFRSSDRIAHEDEKYFTIIALDVRASNREVTSWTQPMLAPVERGRVAMIVRPIDGVLHLLVQAKLEAGVRDVAELGATVQCLPGNTKDAAEDQQPAFLRYVESARPDQIRYDAVQSEEGGRFFHAENRYQVIEVGDEFDLDVPSRFRWVTVHQLTELLEHSNYLNVQARSILASLHTTW